MAQHLSFTVRRHEAILVAPAEPTPNEFKRLSDIDDQGHLRSQIPVIQAYRSSSDDDLMCGRDPAKVIREALSKALVFYYPFAGRLREGPDRKLTVECTGEGVLFVEADANVRLDQFGDKLHPPFPCLEELLYNVEGSGGVLNCPLLLVQVTRLSCGGFIFALRLNHAMADAAGLVQLMNAIGEMARGRQAPAILPVWERQLLDAQNPPYTTFVHREYDISTDPVNINVDMVCRSFFFGPEEVSAMRKYLPSHLRKCSTFEILTACLWKSRTISLGADPESEVSIVSVVDSRSKFSTSPLPKGYYGNVVAFPVAASRADKLCNNPLGYALELVRGAKSSVTEDYMRSVADLMVTKGRPHLYMAPSSFIVSDLSRAGFGDVDYGWGKAVCSGTMRSGFPFCFYFPVRNGIVAPICLPILAMERFVAEIQNFTERQTQDMYIHSAPFIKSTI